MAQKSFSLPGGSVLIKMNVEPLSFLPDKRKKFDSPPATHFSTIIIIFLLPRI
jgi:hypothetical protein